jgi:Lipase (class 3)
MVSADDDHLRFGSPPQTKFAIPGLSFATPQHFTRGSTAVAAAGGVLGGDTAVCCSLPVEQWEIEAAVWLSALAYESHPPNGSSILHAKHQQQNQRFSLRGDIGTFCTSSGQRYLLGTIQHGDHSSVLFCAFAGTHLPGDWERVNCHLPLIVDDSVGAPSHAGFLRRALEVPLEGLVRQKPTRLIFCGHSLGGAVAHLCRLRWLYGHASSLPAEAVVSLAFGAPFFGGTAMLEHIQRHDWLDGFVTIVNGNDPVPRVMNLAANLVETTFQRAFATLLSACVTFVVVAKSNPVAAVTSRLVSELQQVATSRQSQKDRGALEDSFVALYVPIGLYVFFPFHEHDESPDTPRGRSSSSNSRRSAVQVEASSAFVQAALGPANLLHKNPGVIKGVLDRNAITHHHIHAYYNILHAKRNDLRSFTTTKSHHHHHHPTLMTSGHWSEPEEPRVIRTAADLAPRVVDLSCEILMIHESQPCRVIKFHGDNLDFIGDNGSITIDPDNIDPQWSRYCVIDSLITRRTATSLVFEQHLKNMSCNNDEDGFSFLPRKDLRIRLRSDAIVHHGEGRAEIDVILQRQHCHESTKILQDPLSFYGGQFFLGAY